MNVRKLAKLIATMVLLTINILCFQNCSALKSNSSGVDNGNSTGKLPPPGTPPVAFTALHTYYLSPTGSDSNDGLSPNKPWLSPNIEFGCL
jgi:hypothetical protein